jgi:hypothetical protein
MVGEEKDRASGYQPCAETGPNSPSSPQAQAPSAGFTPAIKGFDANLQCRGFQFAIGETYRHEGEVRACRGGFHAIHADAHPLAVFDYYPAAGSRFCIVEIGGATDSDDGVKVAAEIVKVGREIGLGDLAREAVKWVIDRATPEGPVATKDNGLATASGTRGAATASGTQGAATASGTQGAATASGDQGAATASGTRGAATASGDQGAATASGTRGAATASGDQGAATASGDQGAATASGTRGAATASGTRGAATASGDQGAATASGDQGAATASGTRGAATASGTRGAATASGWDGRVMGKEGCALFAVERDNHWDGNILSVACGIVGRDGIEPDTWYRCEGGKLSKAEA